MGVEAEGVDEFLFAVPVAFPAQSRECVKSLRSGETGPECDVARHIRSIARNGSGVAGRIAALYSDRAGIAVVHAQQHPDGGGLPGTVGAEEPVYLTARNLQVKAVDGAQATEGFYENCDFDGVFGIDCSGGARSADSVDDADGGGANSRGANSGGGIGRNGLPPLHRSA